MVYNGHREMSLVLISTTNADLTRYFSTVCIHESQDELQFKMGQAFTRALEA